AALPGATTRVLGALNSTPNTTFTLDFYASPGPDPAGPDEGARYLGSAAVSTDASGNATFDRTVVGATTPGEAVTATAADPAGNTSEFSTAVSAVRLSVIDIEPGDPGNQVNLVTDNVLAVAVLSTADFDAAAVDATDLSRIRFGDVNGTTRVSPIRET